MYSPPTGTELRVLLRRWSLTGRAAGALVDVDSRTVRRWTGDERAMPFASLYVLAHQCEGLSITPSKWRDALL